MMQRKSDHLRAGSILAVAFLFAACAKTPGTSPMGLLSLLSNNRMIVLLKGTYATDNPLSMAEINNDTLFVDGDDPNDTATVPSYTNLPVYLDIGEIRLSSKSFLDPLYDINTAKKSKDFWDIVSTTRQVYCSQPYSMNVNYDSCRQTGGIINYINFMNGEGAVYPSMDVGPATYLHAGVYMRAVVTGFARQLGLDTITTFDNNKVVGYNIMPRVNYDPGTDYATKTVLTPEFFPLHHIVTWGQQGTMVMDNSDIPVVLEIRFNLKENLMVHTFIDSQAKAQTVVAFSDWRKPHAAELDMGGDVLTRARIYYPQFTRDVQVINGGSGSVHNYYALYISNECIDYTGGTACNKNDWLPYAATPARAGVNVLKNIAAGSYVVQCRQDANLDGYPETVVSETPLDVGVGPGVASINVSCP